MIQSIETIRDVETFFKQLVAEGLNFHPDTPFEEYISMETALATYTKEQVVYRDDLLERCFHLCEEKGIDIYGLAYEVFHH